MQDQGSDMNKMAEMASKIVTKLNEFLKADPEAMTEFMKTTIKCNKKLSEDSTIQCHEDALGDYFMPLGFLNGLVGVFSDSKPFGLIGAMVNRDDPNDPYSFKSIDHFYVIDWRS